MIEIGKSLPNSTDPAATTGAADGLTFKALSFSGADHAGRHPRDQPSLTPEYQGCTTRDVHRHHDVAGVLASGYATVLEHGTNGTLVANREVYRRKTPPPRQVPRRRAGHPP